MFFRFADGERLSPTRFRYSQKIQFQLVIERPGLNRISDSTLDRLHHRASGPMDARQRPVATSDEARP